MSNNMTNEEYDDWSIQSIWNELVTEERVPAKRSYIRASEIGKPYLDRYLTMHGVKPTNPFTARILRVFDSGKIFETEVVERMFRLLGLLITSQDEVVVKMESLLPIIGHHDPKVGGKINEKQATQAINDPSVSPWMQARATRVMKKLLEMHPKGLKILITEIKTVNSMAFWAPKNKDPLTGFFKGYDNHKLQLFTYLLGSNHPEGRLFYISKDDLTIMESPVYLANQSLREKWFTDIAEMTRIYKLNKEPEVEPYVVYNPDKGEFEPNWHVGRSSYLTLITGFPDQDTWEKSLSPELRHLNSKPCKGCDKMFTLATLSKHDGYCSRCFKKKGGENNENK